MGIPLKVEYANGILDLACEQAFQEQGVRALQNFPLQGAIVTYVREDSGEVVGAEIIRFDEDERFSELVASVESLGLQARYDVPQLGLREAPLELVLRRCHDAYVHGTHRLNRPGERVIQIVDGLVSDTVSRR